MAAGKNALLRIARSFSSTSVFPTAGTMNKMPIQMWWDMDTSGPVQGFVQAKIEHISKVLQRRDFHGTMKVAAFGDTELLCAETRKELGDAVKVVNHVPTGADLSLVMTNAMREFCRENPSPAFHYVLSGNEDLIPITSELKALGYSAYYGNMTECAATNGCGRRRLIRR